MMSCDLVVGASPRFGNVHNFSRPDHAGVRGRGPSLGK